MATERFDIAKIMRPSGSLDGNAATMDVDYVRWDRGDKTVTLDGSFTAGELRQLADHMEKFSAKEGT